ncbi:MFS transporter [Nonomuraea sp. 3N208]|uniref:MFS transporter n=1 Tax=Nonomuraea sp. 3N208 TaxID=3457421 RepID=UPI003FCD34CF
MVHNVRNSRAVVTSVRQIRCFKELLTDYPQFRWSWVGSTVSMLGSRTIGVTYPLVAYMLTESAAWIGWVMVASTVPALLAYIPAGAITDRFGPRLVMKYSELVRGALVAVLCVLLAFDGLEIHHLVAIALIEGALSVSSSVAETALIPATVKPDNVETALAIHEGSVHGMVLAGRPLSGLLFGIGPIFSFAANAVMFFSSAAVLHRLNPDITAKKPRGKLLREMRAGLEELWRHKFLRSATLITAFINLMVQGLIVVFLSEATNEGLPTALAGVILATSGVGGVIGALISPRRQHIWQKIEEKASRRRWITRLVSRLGSSQQGRSMMLVHLWTCVAALLLPLLFAQLSLTFAVSLLAIGVTGGLSNVTMRTALSRVPPDRVARVVGVSRLGSYSAVAIGPLLASLFVEWVDSFFALLILCAPVVALAALMTTVPALRNSLTSANQRAALAP